MVDLRGFLMWVTIQVIQHNTILIIYQKILQWLTDLSILYIKMDFVNFVSLFQILHYNFILIPISNVSRYDICI